MKTTLIISSLLLLARLAIADNNGVEVPFKYVLQPSDFTLITYKDFLGLLADLQKDPLYDKLFKIREGFSYYDITPIPMCGNDPCQNPIIELADFQLGDEFVKSLPTLLLVAGFHGDEVVGTNAMFRMLQLLRKEFFKSDYYRALLSNTRILILPMANVNGFFNLKRTETVVQRNEKVEEDPNRDFPYDEDPRQGCFVTSTAELLDALFRENLIVSCLTFHGGDNSITYPWGNFPHASQPKSPDDAAFSAVARQLQISAGANPQLGIELYNVGTLHDVVYDVRGGFEDWGFGASFDSRFIDRKCGRRSNPKHELLGQDISYNDFSNRAFLFLVEAGPQKIPDEAALGDGEALASGDFAKGRWGHIARNVNMSLRFAQLTGPFVAVNSLEFKDEQGLVLELAVSGCLEIDSIDVQNVQAQKVEESHNLEKNLLFVKLRVPAAAKVIPALVVNLTCDQKFAQKTNGEEPQSHFVRMKTRSDYKIDYKGFHLGSFKSFQTSLLNIRTPEVGSGILHYAGKSQYSLTYSSSLVAYFQTSEKPNRARLLRLTHDGAKISAVLQGFEEKTSHIINVYSFGTSLSPLLQKQKPRLLLQIKSGEGLEMSAQNFIGLSGRAIEIYKEEEPSRSYASVLHLNMTGEQDEDKNALVMPFNGLSCLETTNGSTEDLKYFSIQKSTEGDYLVLNYYSNSSKPFNFAVGNLKGVFELSKGGYNLGKETYFAHKAKAKIKGPEDSRLGCRQAKIFDASGHQIFACVLGQRDPDVDLRKALGMVFSGTAQDVGFGSFKLIVLLIFLSVLAVAVLYFIYRVGWKKVRARREPAGNELTFDSLSSNQPR